MRWTTVARVSCSFAAASRTACITSRNVKASELTIGTVSCAKGSTVVVLHDTQYYSNIHASASYPECTLPDSGPAIRRSGLAARHRLGRVPPPLTAALHAGMGRYGHPWIPFLASSTPRASAYTGTGSPWKCGCRDQAGTQSYWQIQSFKR